MSLQNETLLETGSEDLVVRPDEVLRVAAQAGASYRVVQGQDKELVTDVVAVRDGANLILHFADGAKVVIEEYFTLCARGDCDVTLPKDGKPSGEASGEVMEQALAAAAEEGRGNGEQNAQIVYVEGDAGQVMDILKGEPALSNALASVESETPQDNEGLLFWSLIGVGVAYGGYELLLDGGSTPVPVFSGGDSATATIEENSSADTVIYDADATGVGQTAADTTVTYSLAGTDAAAFAIDPATGEVRLVESADFEAKSSYSIDIVATDDVTMTTSTQSLTVDVTDIPLSIEGVVTAGPVIAEHGLKVTVYTADGTVLGSAPVNSDGTFSINASPDDYSGLVIVRVQDDSDGPDYRHEGSGKAEDLTVDLRSVGRVDGEGAIKINVNVATEIVVRQLLDDMGGDKGESATKLGTATQAQVEAHHANVLRAFGLDPELDLASTDPHPVNAEGFADASSDAQALGQILAVFAAAEVSSDRTTAEVLQWLAEGTQQGTINQALVNGLATAAAHADSVDGNAGGTAEFLTASADAGVASISISDDSGSSATDFLTNVAAQTINITLIAALTGDQAVYGSVDNGQTWVNIADAADSSVSGTSVSWAKSLSATASQRIVVAVTEDGAPPAEGGSNIVGRSLGQEYVLDTTAPEITVTSLTAAENGAAVDDVEAPDDNGIAATGGYTIAGADASLFSITNDGVLSFTANQDFEAPGDADGDGTYNLDVTVVDAAGNTATKALTVELQDINEKPTVVTPISDDTAVVDQAFSLDVSGNFTDIDADDTLSYSATGLPAGLTISSAGVISGSATAASAATDIVVTATDKGGLAVVDTFSLTVVSAPTISGIALNGGAVVVQSGASHTFDVTFSEPVTVADGTPTLTLDINGTATTATYAAGSGSATLTFTITSPAADGDSVEITAINLAGATVTGDTSGQALITTAVGQTTTDLTIDDAGPSVTTTSLDADENSTAVGSIAATDANGIAAAGGYTLAGPDVALFAISDAGVLTFTGNQDFEAPSDADGDGVYNIDVTVTDTVGNDTTQSVTVNLQNVNEAPTVDSEISDTSAVVDQAFSLDVSGNFTDPDAGDTLTYSATGLPPGLSISSAGVISGTATTAATAVSIVVTATDSDSNSVTDTFELGVVSAPTASSTADGVTNLDVRSPIVLTFSENVSIGASGTITLTDLNTNGEGWKNDTTDNSQTIDITTAVASGEITIAGNIVTINPEFDLDFATNYEITISAGAFTGDTSGENSLEVQSGDLTFTTVTPATGNSGVLSQIQVAGTDAIVNSHYWVDGHQGIPSGASIDVDASEKDIAVAISLADTGKAFDHGFIRLLGVTDTSDIVYGDDTNAQAVTDLNREAGVTSNEGGTNKVIDREGNGEAAKVTYVDSVNVFFAYNNTTLEGEGIGAVIYG